MNQSEEKELTRFVIYARMSSDESADKQMASIPQQIEKCFECHKREGIPLALRPRSTELDEKTLEEIEKDNMANPSKARELKAFYAQYWVITERHSAKTPFKRMKWREIVKQAKNGEIKGLLGYSPDRFSRNLQEGGELIQLVENEYISIKFTNFQFENNAAGQMMLGIWFVFAENFSKKLQEDVLRGSEKKHLEGCAIGSRKFGYIMNKEDRFMPDPIHFSILKKAFKRKIYDNWSDSKIADEMNKNKWHQILKKRPTQNTNITPQKISNNNLWSDPFYYGVFSKEFKGVEVKVDLRVLEVPSYKFEPLITEEEWLLLQDKLSDRRISEVRKRQSLKSQRLDPVKPTPDQFVLCDECKSVMSYMLPNRKRFENRMKKERKLLEEIVRPDQIRYTCHNRLCKNRGLEIKWDKIDAKIAEIFGSMQVCEEDYQAYLYAKKEELEQEHVTQKEEIQRLCILINKAEADHRRFLKETNYGVGLTGKIGKNWRDDNRKHEDKIKEYENRKAELRADTRDVLLEQQAFIEKIKSLGKTWKKLDYVQKRKLLEVLCLNMTVNAKKGLQINIKPEIADMFIQSGGPNRNRTGNLSNANAAL